MKIGASCPWHLHPTSSRAVRSTALRYPAPMPVRPQLPVASFAGVHLTPAPARHRRPRGAPPNTHFTCYGGPALGSVWAFAPHALTFSQRVGSRAHPTRLPDSVRCRASLRCPAPLAGLPALPCGGVRHSVAHPVAIENSRHHLGQHRPRHRPDTRRQTVHSRRLRTLSTHRDRSHRQRSRLRPLRSRHRPPRLKRHRRFEPPQAGP
jgi:hypothetical protein